MPFPPRPSALRTLVLALSASLALGACGSDGSDAGLPAAVGEVFANPAPGAADVGWTASPSTSVDGYVVSASAAGGAPMTQTVAAGTTGLRLSGLQADTDYAITVQAQNAFGTSPALGAGVHTPRPTNTPAEASAFSNAATYAQNHGGDAVVIMRDGQIVFERYRSGLSASDPHVLASGTKSFSCALMLGAEQDGIARRDDKLSDTLTEWRSDANKAPATVRQVLSLQGGLTGNPNYSPANVANLDTYQLALDDSARYAPGQAFVYDPLAFQAYALLFERRGGGDPVSYLQARVFAPIGLTGDLWQRDAANHPQMAGGATVSAPMWLRYGQLMLQHGTWETRRVLPAEGVSDCLTYSNPAYLGYGITWWLNRPVGNTYDPAVDVIPADGVAGSSGQIAPGAPADMVMAAGTGHQRLYLLPTQRLVVVRFAPLDTENDDWSDDEFLSRLLDY